MSGDAGETRIPKWLAAVVVVGTTAGVVAAGLLWMVLAHPIALAEAIGRVW